ncbi:DUF1801 domain-containing protein [Shimia sp.]|uniref:DUF1801 domain-containing protein n=1 Tax=Shimia sp. TaxID=1954381 RepID=UPI003B8E5B8C
MTVSSYIDSLPPAPRAHLNLLQQIIRNAADTSAATPLTENLKWGQPSYAPPKGMGTPIRLSWSEKTPDHVAFLVHCQTSLVEEWRLMFGETYVFDGNRAVHLQVAQPLPKDALHQMAVMALTYHTRKP